jgi:hypothetical protein
VDKKDKLLKKARNNPQGLRFSKFETLLSLCDWVFDHQTGSHRIWYSPTKVRLSIQPNKDGEAKAYQVKNSYLYRTNPMTQNNIFGGFTMGKVSFNRDCSKRY